MVDNDYSKEVYDTAANLLKKQESTNSKMHIATVPEIIQYGINCGWSQSITHGAVCSNTQIVVDPEKDAVFAVQGKGPITADAIAHAIHSPRRRLLQFGSSPNSYDAVILTEDELQSFYRMNNLNCQKYSLSKLAAIVSNDYSVEALIEKDANTHDKLRLKFAVPQGYLLRIMTGDNHMLAKNYLDHIVDDQLSKPYCHGDSSRVLVENPFANLRINKPFAALVEFPETPAVGFRFVALRTTAFDSGWQHKALYLSHAPESRVGLKTFNMAEAYLLAREFIPPYALEHFKEKLRTEDYRNKRILGVER